MLIIFDRYLSMKQYWTLPKVVLCFQLLTGLLHLEELYVTLF